MCGIVGAVAQRDVSAILIEGLRRLEYRGCDSAGIALIAYGLVGLLERGKLMDGLFHVNSLRETGAKGER